MPKKAFRWTKAACRRHLREFLENIRTLPGLTHYRFLDARDGRDCPACLDLASRVFVVADDPPGFPPADCRCQPYGCRLCAVVV